MVFVQVNTQLMHAWLEVIMILQDQKLDLIQVPFNLLLLYLVWECEILHAPFKARQSLFPQAL